MVKCIIHCADIHIRNVMRHEEYAEQLENFIKKCSEIASKYEKDEVRIVIVGDLVHSKNNVSNELFSFASTFIRELQEIAKVIVISGNHDLIESNTSRKDTMTALFETAGFENSIFLDNYLDYESGIVMDDNITWAVYSIYSGYERPDIESAKNNSSDNKVVGLFHGTVVGAVLPNGRLMDEGTDGDKFRGCDCVMAGHIHRHQDLKRGDVTIVYPSSLIQQDFGETVTQHGFVVWDIENGTHEFVELETKYGMYNIEIKEIEDLDEDKETLLNY